MTDKNLTEIIAILDRSGSMTGLIAATISGFNGFIDEQRTAPGRAKLTLVQFDDRYQIDYEGLELENVPKLDTSTYVPCGMTALYDGIGRTVNAVGQRLAATPEDERPGQVIVLIITDGAENSSREFKLDQVREMVKTQTDVYNWRFVFLGGGNLDDQRDAAASMGFSASNSYQYSANAAGTNAVYAGIARGVVRSRELQTSGHICSASDALLNEQEIKDLVND